MTCASIAEAEWCVILEATAAAAGAWSSTSTISSLEAGENMTGIPLNVEENILKPADGKSNCTPLSLYAQAPSAMQKFSRDIVMFEETLSDNLPRGRHRSAPMRRRLWNCSAAALMASFPA